MVSNVPCETTFIGELPAGSNGLAGRVYLLNRITFAVVGFSYDGGAIGEQTLSLCLETLGLCTYNSMFGMFATPEKCLEYMCAIHHILYDHHHHQTT